jgi:hypothetical protein
MKLKNILIKQPKNPPIIMTRAFAIVELYTTNIPDVPKRL